MTRTTRAELDQLAVVINRTLDIVPHINAGKDTAYYVQGAYGRVRLVKDNGSVEVSPSLTTGELARWMRAFHAGIVLGMQHEADGRDGLLQGPPERGGRFAILKETH